MKLLPGLAVIFLLAAGPAFAQGVRMSADFLPLAVGNRWFYDVTNEQGQPLGQIDFAVQQHSIIAGRSFYVLTEFPFVVSLGDPVRLLRYDRLERQFIRMVEDEEGPLFLSDGASTEVLQADAAGLPQKFILQTDTAAFTFQRGVGIVEARYLTENGIHVAKIARVRIGEGLPGAGAAAADAPATAGVAEAS